jgi:hypothetical protein
VRAFENMIFLANYYDEFFSPHVELIVVEQGARSALDLAALLPNCKHIFLGDDGPFNRRKCFAAGIERSGPDRKLFILSDDDIYLETLDIRANLRMCERYACATGFDRIVDLSDEDSARLLATKTTRGIDITDYDAPAECARPGYYRFATRAAALSLCEGGDSGEGTGELPQSPPLRAFRSPNHALRLRRG